MKKDLSQQLKGYARRLRLVRAWRGLAVGLAVGAALCLVLAVLDFSGAIYSEWNVLAMVASVSAIVGGLAGFLLKVSPSSLARSVDRRAELRDRLVTSCETVDDNAFLEPLREDAMSHLERVHPASVYPFRFGKWQVGALALSAFAAAIFLLGNTPILLTDKQRQELAELQREGAKVERVVRQNLDDPDLAKQMSEEERKMANELLRLKRDLDKRRLTKEEALQRANEIASKAEELMKDRLDSAKQSLGSSETALDKLRKEAMEKAGMKTSDVGMMKLSDQERSAQMDALQKQLQHGQQQMNSLQSQLDALQSKMQKANLSDAERRELAKLQSQLEKELEELNKNSAKNAARLKDLALSKEAQDVFRKMMQNPLYKKLQELASKMAKNMEAAEASGRPELTKEQLEQMRKELEELAKQLKDDKAMKAYLEALIKAMEEGQQMTLDSRIGAGLRLPIPGAGAPSDDVYAGDSGQINKLDKSVPGRGKTSATMVTGKRDESKGREAYIEIKAPTSVGTRTSVPYRQVLPSYRKKAEAALDRKEIPKEHQKRVREYFESLTGK
jgi:hypothetical protein